MADRRTNRWTDLIRRNGHHENTIFVRLFGGQWDDLTGDYSLDPAPRTAHARTWLKSIQGWIHLLVGRRQPLFRPGYAGRPRSFRTSAKSNRASGGKCCSWFSKSLSIRSTAARPAALLTAWRGVLPCSAGT